MKTKTITIEFPQPVQEPLEIGQEYYVANFNDPNDFLQQYWRGVPINFTLLKEGRIHLTKRAAIAHGKAVYKAFGISEEKANER